jgi:hypothetical protein
MTMTTPSTLQARSPINRSWKSTIGYLIGGVVCAGISVLLFMMIASGPITIGIALIPGVLALILFYMAVGGAGECSCPSCGKPLSGLSTGANNGVLCPGCHHYFEGKNGELWATDDTLVADAPTFASIVPEKFAFPPGCCVCGKESTRNIPISLHTTNASSVVTQSTIGLTTSTRTTVEVPHCGEHKDGAILTGTKDKPHIKFRSYPYLRAFCALNNTMPG